MDNQLHLFLLFWAVDYQKIDIYSDESFVIPNKYFHKYYIPYWGWETSLLAAIKNSIGY